MRKILSLVLLSVLLSGCTVPVNYYIRNLTNTPIKVTLVKDESFDTDTFELQYSKEVLPVNFNTHKKLNDTQKQEVEGNNVNIVIEPQSTYYLGFGANFKHLIKEVIIYQNSKPDTLDLNDKDQLKTSGSFLSKYAAWYDIENQ